MIGQRRARQADEAFYETIREVLGCISDDGLFTKDPKHDNPRRSRVLGLLSNRARLETMGAARLHLAMEHEYTVEQVERGDWRVRTEAYIYTVFASDAQTRLLGYHYHPAGRGEVPVAYPHLHVYLSQEVGGKSLQKIHLPTSRVALEDVVMLLITGFDVRPRRDDWEDVLTEARRAFVGLRRWS